MHSSRVTSEVDQPSSNAVSTPGCCLVATSGCCAASPFPPELASACAHPSLSGKSVLPIGWGLIRSCMREQSFSLGERYTAVGQNCLNFIAANWTPGWGFGVG